MSIDRIYEMTGKAGTICPPLEDNQNLLDDRLCRGNFDDDAMLKYLTMPDDQMLKLVSAVCMPSGSVVNWHKYIKCFDLNDKHGRGYKEYLRSNAWKRKRDMVMKRAKGICEKTKCSKSAEQVHHLTYANVGKETLEDLQAMCKGCHASEHKLAI